MGYCFEDRDRNIQGGFRRIAAEQVDKAIKESTDAQGDAVPKAIHNVRKRCKRLRGLIRLFRFSFAGYAGENAAIRDIAAGLSRLRDANVVGETLDKAANAWGDAVDPAVLDKLKGHLADRSRHLKAGQDEAAALQEFRDDLASVRQRIDDWGLDDSGFQAIADGLGDVYRRARRDMRSIKREPSPESFHDWRKQVKYHFYHLCLLRNVAPHVLAGPRDLANELAETLGDHHDIAVFLDVLDGERSPLDPTQEKRVRSLLVQRQDELGAQAFLLGHELAAERTSCIVERIGAYWSHWREGGEESGQRNRAKIFSAA